MDPKTLCGKVILTGFKGFELSIETAQFIRENAIGGVILFAHNIDTPGQVLELCQELQALRSDMPLWISIDQEGGRVQRIKKGLSRIPDAQSIAKENSPKLSFEISQIIASELKALGINLNFTPVADILTNPKNQVIGNRSYGVDAQTVSEHVTAVIRGHLTQGVQACVKHFPGHGDTNVDSHYALPKLDLSLLELQKRELLPFEKAIRAKVKFLMTGHLLFPKIDPDQCVSFSSIFLQDILRKQLHYKGLIVSDDLEMKALGDTLCIGQCAVRCIQAGVDLIIVRSERGAREAHAGLLKGLENGDLSLERLRKSAKLSEDLKASFLMPYQAPRMDALAQKLSQPESQERLKRIQ